MGDDIGYWNISAYNRGMMGYRTPNIDRIANEGAIFTDYYAQQSCTAGRAAFITGQSPIRTGLLKVGLPSAKEGLSDKDPTLAELLKPEGYVTGQFGKNHLGDRNEFLPTVHGFDEFFGNLYHLNAEEEPENPDYPKASEYPNFAKNFGPRGVLKCVATATETPGDDPRFGPWGKQKCEDTGPITKKRMETVDGEFLDASLDFIDRANKDKKPFFVWFNSTRMHIFTHLKPESQGSDRPRHLSRRHGRARRHGRPAPEEARRSRHRRQHDRDLHHRQRRRVFSWPDGGTTPFRSEKNTNWEGGYRVPAMVRWPGVVKPHTEINGIFSSEDWVPTLVAAAGEPDMTQKLLKATTPPARPSRSISTASTSTICSPADRPSARSSSTGPTTAISPGCATTNGRWCSSSSSMKACASGRSRLFRCARRCSFNLRTDPFEKAMLESGEYEKWYVERMFVMAPAQAIVAQRAADVQGLPAAPEAGQLLGRRRPGQAPERPTQQQLTETRAAVRLTFGGASICLLPDCGEFGCLHSSD